MNKKGFLSTSMVYSFFLIFLMLLVFIVANLINNRTLISRINAEIKESIYNSSLSGYLINEFNAGNIPNIVYHNNDELKDNSYRYVGANPNNYVCFGASTPCPDNNLYRIIGIIDGKVKLIKNTPITNFAIDEVTSNFSATNLADYLNNATDANTNYYDTIKNYSNYIATTSYHIGGISTLPTDIVEVYNAEMTSSTILRQVGLMYISDYYFAADTTNANWLASTDTWFITKDTSVDTATPVDGEITLEKYNYYYLSGSAISTADITTPKNIRPVFYLKNNVTLLSGTGKSDDPFIIGGNNV